jgi:pimeloyl-ACP methyl ester carboxylesterase
MRLHSIEVNGHVVAAEIDLREGDRRPPVVFLPGVLTTPKIGSMLRRAVPDRSWIGVSLPGHHPGRFGVAGPPRITARSFANPTEKILHDILGGQQVVAVGWSLGGFSALSLAVHHPERVAAVASLAGIVRGGVRGITGLIARLARMPIVRHGVPMGLHLARSMPRVHAYVAQACTAKTSGMIPPALLDEMHAAYQLHDARSTAAVMAGVPELDITAALGSIGVPTWIAAGEHDPIVPVAESRRIADAIPSAKLKVYRNAGHMFFCEWPGVERDFAAWLDRVSAVS